MGSQKTAFVKQAAILASAGLVVRLIGFAYRLPLTNLIGDEGNGIYAASFYLYMFFLIMSSAGLPAAISKMVSQRVALKQYRSAQRIFYVSLAVASVAGFVSASILYFGAEWLSVLVVNPRSKTAIQTLSPTVFIVAVMSVFRGYFQGMSNTVPTATSQFVEQVFNAIFSVYLAYILLPRGLAYAVAGATGAKGIGAVAGLAVLLGIYLLALPVFRRRIQRFSKETTIEAPLSIARELLGTAAPIIVGTAIFSMTNLIDMQMVMNILINNGHTNTEAYRLYGMLTGKYATLTTLPVSISTAFAVASIPSIASSVALGKKAEANRKINMALRLTMVLSIPAAVGIGVLANPILLLLFPAHPEGGSLLQVGAVSIIFFALVQITTGMLQGSGYVYIPAIAALCGALLKIPLNRLLIPIPQINVHGAVISTIACCMVAAIIDLVMLKKKTGVRLDFMGFLLKPLISSTAMGIGCFVFYHFIYFIVPSNTLATLAAILIGVVIYFGFMVIIRGLSEQDLNMIPGGQRLGHILRRYEFI